MADLVEDVKNRLDIVDVVSQYVQLKKAGHSYKGLCPFHSEKTPSFVVSPEKQICYCFGCNKGGDMFAFIQELEGVSFVEALEVLADRAGLKLDVGKFRKKEDKSEKDEYYRAHDLACEFFEKQLYKTETGKKVLEYLYKRGLRDATIREFRLGFAPDKYEELYPYLIKKGISKDVLIRSGFVAVKNLASGKIYDKYRARLMFPIFNYLGKICGFGGRALKSDQAPKYLNSPENPIYNKSSVVYGLYQAKQHIKEAQKAILVEGYFDVLLPYQEGICNVVASSGTALTGEHLRTLARITRHIVTCFDSDDAGFEATKRAYLIAQSQKISVSTVSDLEEKDPADFVQKKGAEFKKVIDRAVDFIKFFIEKLLSGIDAQTLGGRRRVIAELLPLYHGMPPSEKDYFVRMIAQKLSMQERYVYEEMENYKLPAVQSHEGDENRTFSVVKLLAGELILALVLEYPYLFDKVSEELGEHDLEEGMKNVYKILTDQYNSARDKFAGWNFDKGFLAKNREKIAVWRLYAEEKYGSFSEPALESEIEKLIDKVKKERRVKQLTELQSKIIESEKSQDNELLKRLLEEQQALLNK